jgi:L-Ala-D/L-Glu epimerase
MKLVNLTWYPYRIPFREAFVTAHGTLNHRTGAVVCVQTEDEYLGNGEIAPLPEFNGAHLTEILNTLPRLAKELCGREITDILRFLDAQSQDSQLPAPLICGLETALLDALGQAGGQSLASLLANDVPYGQTNQAFMAGVGKIFAPTENNPSLPKSCTYPSITLRSRIPVNAVITGATTEIIIAKARAAINAGFTCLKLKITEATSATIERVSAVRTAIGSEPRLRLDANENWNLAQATSMLTQCAPYDIQYVEQPLPAHDIANMAHLRCISPIPIAADEALSNLTSARHIFDAEAADVLILKPQLVGGLHTCRQIIQEAKQHKIDCVITSTLESGIGVAAALHLAAASPEVTLACGLATLDLLKENLLSNPFSLAIRNGLMDAPLEPGLGMQVDMATLKHYEED